MYEPLVRCRPMADRNGKVVPVRRVRKAYEQVADQLRDLVMSGELQPAQRLPNETALAAQFGVSRSTVREALRELSALSLIRTTKGASGGSFVTVPTADHISEFLSANIGLLSQSEHVSLDEFLEARRLLEVPAARLAAHRRADSDLERLRAAIPDRPLEREEQFIYNKDFHFRLVEASGNTLLSICAHPVFSVLQSSLKRSTLPKRFHDRVNADHRALVASLEARDEDAVAEQMSEHLDFLSITYRKAWRFPTAPSGA
jgi:GntR family transcriptional regulator, transcriptional repressor for pyruvate dehydrogenase complex